MQLTSGIDSGHRLHLSVWICHLSAPRLSCCIITCLEVTSGISSGTTATSSFSRQNPEAPQCLV